MDQRTLVWKKSHINNGITWGFLCPRDLYWGYPFVPPHSLGQVTYPPFVLPKTTFNSSFIFSSLCRTIYLFFIFPFVSDRVSTQDKQTNNYYPRFFPFRYANSSLLWQWYYGNKWVGNAMSVRGYNPFFSIPSLCCIKPTD